MFGGFVHIARIEDLHSSENGGSTVILHLTTRLRRRGLHEYHHSHRQVLHTEHGGGCLWDLLHLI